MINIFVNSAVSNSADRSATSLKIRENSRANGQKFLFFTQSEKVLCTQCRFFSLDIASIILRDIKICASQEYGIFDIQ